VKIVVVSDTHGKHSELGVLAGDFLIHCGDGLLGFEDNPNGVAELDAWFGQQRFERILCIGGNHDFALQELAARPGSPLRNAEYSRTAPSNIAVFGSSAPHGRQSCTTGPTTYRQAISNRAGRRFQKTSMS
jgi:predicted phosphodiesterase